MDHLIHHRSTNKYQNCFQLKTQLQKLIQKQNLWSSQLIKTPWKFQSPGTKNRVQLNTGSYIHQNIVKLTQKCQLRPASSPSISASWKQKFSELLQHFKKPTSDDMLQAKIYEPIWAILEIRGIHILPIEAKSRFSQTFMVWSLYQGLLFFWVYHRIEDKTSSIG